MSLCSCCRTCRTWAPGKQQTPETAGLVSREASVPTAGNIQLLLPVASFLWTVDQAQSPSSPCKSLAATLHHCRGFCQSPLRGWSLAVPPSAQDEAWGLVPAESLRRIVTNLRSISGLLQLFLSHDPHQR